jgi:hypothetical protein
MLLSILYQNEYNASIPPRGNTKCPPATNQWASRYSSTVSQKRDWGLLGITPIEIDFDNLSGVYLRRGCWTLRLLLKDKCLWVKTT